MFGVSNSAASQRNSVIGGAWQDDIRGKTPELLSVARRHFVCSTLQKGSEVGRSLTPLAGSVCSAEPRSLCQPGLCGIYEHEQAIPLPAIAWAL
jgi:hypothetical protein